MRTKRLLIGVIATLLVPHSVSAQEAGLIDQAERQAGAGVFSEARALLQQWLRANPNAARTNQEELARFHLLSARLTTNADSAEDHYFTIAVNHPTTRMAPEALLRLAQARHARGDSQSAATYLQRLLSDYPDTEHRAMATIWLARVQPRSADMCAMLRGANPGTNPEVIEHLKNEITRVCTGRAAPAPRVVTEAPKTTPSDTPRTTPRTTTAPAQAPTREPAPAPATATSATGRVAIQIGAFREVAGARSVKNELERAGFTDVRLVRVPGNNLIRVRIGRFENRAAASATLARLAARDISAVLVTDANTETRVP